VDGEWTIRREPREKVNAGSLKLPETALSIIEAQPRIAGNPFIFAGRGETTVFNAWSQRKEEVGQGIAYPSAASERQGEAGALNLPRSAAHGEPDPGSGQRRQDRCWDWLAEFPSAPRRHGRDCRPQIEEQRDQRGRSAMASL
jgi:hypothetical protein